MRIRPIEGVAIDGFRFDPERGEFTYQNLIDIHITPMECYLLHPVMEGRGKIISREYLWANSKGPGIEPDTDPKIVDVLMCKIRRKIKAATDLEPIKTSWGRGYYWELNQPS